jgi:hypothetical protein
MTNSMRRWSTFSVSAAFLSLSACSTQEISRQPPLRVSYTAGPDNSELLLAFSPSVGSYEELQAAPNLTPYSLFLDGRQLVREDLSGGAQPIIAHEGAEFGFGYLPSGPHHFTLEAPGGGAPLFAGDAEIAPGSTTILYLFGPRDALEGRFLSLPRDPAPGMLHVSVLNLVRGGPRIEVVSCADAAPCAPITPALALGEIFVADFPSVDGDIGQALADGRTIGFRPEPTADLPAPRVQQITSARSGTAPTNVIGPVAPFNYAVAPYLLYATGEVHSYFLN